MNAVKTAIYNRLSVDAPVKRDQLRAYLWHTGREISDRKMRQTIADMIQTDGILIKSGPDGYKLSSSVKDYEKAIAYVSKYAMSLLKKRSALKRNYNRMTAKLIPA
jgi:hypothetical protein